MHFRWSQVLLLVLLLAAGLGCGDSGPELASVTGTITLDGAPAPKLTIRFLPKDGNGSPSYGGTNAEGKYTMLYSHDRQGVMLGEHDVEIEAAERDSGDDGKPAGKDPSRKIPARYRKAGTLTADVKSGRNSIDFKLESKPDATN